MKLLLVEDSERLQRSLSTGLQKHGFTVDQAYDGEEALVLGIQDWIFTKSIDVIQRRLGSKYFLSAVTVGSDQGCFFSGRFGQGLQVFGTFLRGSEHCVSPGFQFVDQGFFNFKLTERFQAALEALIDIRGKCDLAGSIVNDLETLKEAPIFCQDNIAFG